jgi:tetratricopeptide (TPR) repeat protein
MDGDFVAYRGTLRPGLLQTLPRQFRRIVSRCLRMNPAQRYQCADEILREIEAGLTLSSKRSKMGLTAFASVALLACSAMLKANRSGFRDHITSIALYPISCTPEYQEAGEFLYQFLERRLVLTNEVNSWIVPAGLKIRPPDQLMTKTDVQIAIDIRGAARGIAAELTISSGTHKRRSIHRSLLAPSVYSLRQKVWEQIRADVKLRTDGSFAPTTDTGELESVSSKFLQANHVLRWTSKDAPSYVPSLQAVMKDLNGIVIEHRKCPTCIATHCEAEIVLGVKLLDEQMVRKGLTELNQLLVLDSGKESTFWAAEMYARARQYESALRLLQDRRLSLLGSEGGKALAGSIFEEQGSYLSAIGELKLVVDRNHLDLRSLNKLGMAQTNAAEYEDAAKSFKAILAVDPSSLAALNNVATAYMYSGRMEEAAHLLEEVVNRAPSPASYANLGMVFFFEGKGALGLPFFKQAAALDASMLNVGNLCHAYRWSGMKSEASACYEHAISLASALNAFQTNGKVLAELGLYFAAVGKRDMFDATFDKAISVTPADLDVLYKEAVGYALLGDMDEAKPLLKRLSQMDYPISYMRSNPDLAQLKSYIDNL